MWVCAGHAQVFSPGQRPPRDALADDKPCAGSVLVLSLGVHCCLSYHSPTDTPFCIHESMSQCHKCTTQLVEAWQCPPIPPNFWPLCPGEGRGPCGQGASWSECLAGLNHSCPRPDSLLPQAVPTAQQSGGGHPGPWASPSPSEHSLPEGRGALCGQGAARGSPGQWQEWQTLNEPPGLSNPAVPLNFTANSVPGPLQMHRGDP